MYLIAAYVLAALEFFEKAAQFPTLQLSQAAREHPVVDERSAAEIREGGCAYGRQEDPE